MGNKAPRAKFPPETHGGKLRPVLRDRREDFQVKLAREVGREVANVLKGVSGMRYAVFILDQPRDFVVYAKNIERGRLVKCLHDLADAVSREPDPPGGAQGDPLIQVVGG